MNVSNCCGAPFVVGFVEDGERCNLCKEHCGEEENMTSEELKEALIEYRSLSSVIKDATAARKEFGKQIENYLLENKAKRIKTPKGIFTLREITSWDFSEDVLMMEEEVKFAKEEEKENGKAVPKTTYGIAFREKEEKETHNLPTLTADI